MEAGVGEIFSLPLKMGATGPWVQAAPGRETASPHAPHVPKPQDRDVNSVLSEAVETTVNCYAGHKSYVLWRCPSDPHPLCPGVRRVPGAPRR